MVPCELHVIEQFQSFATFDGKHPNSELWMRFYKYFTSQMVEGT